VSGSWKIIPTAWERIRSHAFAGAPTISCSSIRIEPVTRTRALGGSSPAIARHVTDLPEPDSPTMPIRSPRSTWRLTERTAWMS